MHGESWIFSNHYSSIQCHMNYCWFAAKQFAAKQFWLSMLKNVLYIFKGLFDEQLFN